ncbi:MAG: 2-C-methyl-D-erythritol 4-phosphate cytidylyltransferase [Clostridia bacterium]|nr:2-C-methyl-D-erythritol 4-phosphate cytidylyltransferase [Clostridia bacterium]
MSRKSVTAIILVAGNSTRFGKNRNKNFEIIEGKEVLLYSLEKFNQNKLVDNIVIVCKKDEENLVQKIVSKITLNKDIQYVKGGATRQESVYNAITKTNSDIVIIHDGARPMIQDKFITECIEEMDNFKGVSIAVKSKDTIKITDDNGIVKETTLRKNTWVIQTPQCFERKILLEMHEKFMGDETVTDDCMLMERSGNEVKLICGEYSNIKVTTYDDVNLVEGYLTAKE